MYTWNRTPLSNQAHMFLNLKNCAKIEIQMTLNLLYPENQKTLKCQNKTDSRGSLKRKNQSTLVARSLQATSMVRPEAISSIPTW